jgi:nuclear GTP-binding protein
MKNRAAKNQLSAPAEETFEDVEEVEEDNGLDMKTQSYGQNSRRAFLSELRKIVDSADVILHVLDARDPAGTRSTAIEEMVLSHSGKKLVYVLNKADLVPRQVLSGWLQYLRQYHPAVPFKCNTQSQKGNLGRTSGKIGKLDDNALLSHQAIGVEELLGLMKNYCRNDGGQTKASISVGIVGMPNVGKSSLINSLTRTRAVNVSSTPGHTKLMQEVILDKNIRLLDSPGVVFADADQGSTVLRNCVNVEEMEDVVTPIEEILNRCPAAYLMQLYAIPKFSAQDTMGFLALVARSTGKLKKGGIPHTDAAARGILHDWNNGKIKYYCKPPDMKAKSSASRIAEEQARGDTMILSSYSDGLDLDNMQDGDIQVLDALHAVDNVAFIPMETRQFVGGEGAADDMEGDDEESAPVASSRASRSRSRTSSKSTISTSTRASKASEDSAAVSGRLVQKKDKKKNAKEERRSKRGVVAEPAEDYDFDRDFQY